MEKIPQQIELYSESPLYSRGICREHEPSVAEATLGCWELHIQPGAGRFYMERDFLVTSKILLYTDYYLGSANVLGATRSETFSMAFTLNCVPGTNFFGENLVSLAALAGFDSCVDVALGAGQRLLILVMERSVLTRYLAEDQLEYIHRLWTLGRFSLSQKAAAHAGAVLLQLLALSRGNRIAYADFEHDIMEAASELLRASVPNLREKPASSPLRRHGYEKALLYLESVSDTENIPIGQLARVAGVSQRTLEYAFREYSDYSPREYLKRRRYQKIRRKLLTASNATTVQDIASQLGVFEFGRMAVEYRLMFGESPSATLSRRQPNHTFAYSA